MANKLTKLKAQQRAAAVADRNASSPVLALTPDYLADELRLAAQWRQIQAKQRKELADVLAMPIDPASDFTRAMLKRAVDANPDANLHFEYDANLIGVSVNGNLFPLWRIRDKE